MQLIRKTANARVGLLGNPSDGYNGKTLSLVVPRFRAKVVLYEWEDVEVVLSQEDRSRFGSFGELARDVELHGYYGGIRLIKATAKRFYDYCQDRHELHDRNFSIRYESNIPRMVGLAGSSAIIVATLRALMEFFDVEVPLEVQPSLALSVETEELGIAAGLQDRVVQVYGGLVYMDFAKERMTTRTGLECGVYQSISTDLLPPLYVAYSADVSEPTEKFHNDLRNRYESGDKDVRSAMTRFAELAEEGHQALVAGESDRITALVDENFDLRRRLCRLPEKHVEMIEMARKAGASAKFAGSGGAIVGTYEDEAMYDRLCQELGRIGCRVLKPVA